MSCPKDPLWLTWLIHFSWVSSMPSKPSENFSTWWSSCQVRPLNLFVKSGLHYCQPFWVSNSYKEHIKRNQRSFLLIKGQATFLQRGPSKNLAFYPRIPIIQSYFRLQLLSLLITYVRVLTDWIWEQT